MQIITQYPWHSLLGDSPVLCDGLHGVHDFVKENTVCQVIHCLHHVEVIKCIQLLEQQQHNQFISDSADSA